MTAKSRSGWIVRFAGAPITWASKMQTITAMSTTEAEYIALSPGLREVIPLMGLLTEARSHGLRIDDLLPKIHCTVFEDNSGALDLARLPKSRPRTKHSNQGYHHFRRTRGAKRYHIRSDTDGIADCRYPQQALGRACFYAATQSHDGLVGHYVYEQKGVFKNTTKGCKNQIVMAGRLLIVLDMCPSTTNNPTNNNDPKFTVHELYASMETILDPKLTSQDHKQAQTPVGITTGLLHTQYC